MPDTHSHMNHPKGTLFIIGLYGLLFVVGWFAMYVFVYLRRGGGRFSRRSHVPGRILLAQPGGRSVEDQGDL